MEVRTHATEGKNSPSFQHISYQIRLTPLKERKIWVTSPVYAVLVFPWSWGLPLLFPHHNKKRGRCILFLSPFTGLPSLLLSPTQGAYSSQHRSMTKRSMLTALKPKWLQIAKNSSRFIGFEPFSHIETVSVVSLAPRRIPTIVKHKPYDFVLILILNPCI